MHQTFLIDDFSKGIDLISSINNVQVGFSPNAVNFRVSEYGGVEKILAPSLLGTITKNDYHELAAFRKSDGSYNKLVAANDTTWDTVDSAGAVVQIRSGLTAVSDTTFAIHDDVLYGLDGKNNIATWDGATLTSYSPGVNTGPPKGIILGVWRNRLWVAKADASGNPTMTVEWSDPPDATTGFVGATDMWPTANSVILAGSGNSDRIVGGMPTSDGLVIFCQNSVYTITDETTGENFVVDPHRGCSSRKSLAILDGKIYGVCGEGIFATDGRFPLEIISRRIDPLFRGESPDLSHAAGISYGRSYFLSYERTGYSRITGTTPSFNSRNNVTIEYTPIMDAFMFNEYAVTAWAHSDMDGDLRLYAIASHEPSTGANTMIWKCFEDGGPWEDSGSEVGCYYETAPINLGDERSLKRMRKIRAVGRGQLYVGLRPDYEFSSPDGLYDAILNFSSTGSALWDTAEWDEFEWGGYNLREGFGTLPHRGRRFSIAFFESSSLDYSARNALNQTPDYSVSGAAIYLLEPHFQTTSRYR